MELRIEEVWEIRRYAFVVKSSIHLKFLQIDKKEFILSKQLLRSGTYIDNKVKEARERIANESNQSLLDTNS